MLIQNYTMYGKTARVFPFAPNWASPVNETLEWKTDVLRSRDGSEQRRSLRSLPRRGFEYSLVAQKENLSILEACLWGWQDKHFALPVWTDIGKLTANVSIGQTALPVDTTNLGFNAGDWVIVFAGPQSYEVVQLASVTSASLGLSSAMLGNWPAGTKVYPLLLSHLGTSVSVSRPNGSVGEIGNVAFQSSPDSAYAFITAGSPSAMYDGIEVVTHKPNWRAAIQNDFTHEFDIVDAGVGPIGYFPGESTSRIVRPFQWLLKTRAEIAAFRSFVGRMRGQAKTCWVPSWHDDLTVAGSNASDQSVLTIAGTWLNTYIGVDLSRDRLAVRRPDGVTVYRRVLSMSPNYGANTTALQLDANLGTTVSSGDNTRVQFLLRCRLATDKIVIPWLTDRVSEPQTAFTTVKL